MIKAIIFDFDGVLVLSEKSQFEVIQQIAKKYNIIINAGDISKMVGRTTLNFLTSILTEREKSFLGNIIKDYEKEFKGNIIRYVGPVDFSVNYIKNYNGPLIFAIASMSSKKVITTLTDNFGIYRKFKVIVTREEIQEHKPNPEIYLKAALKLDMPPDECVVIEDSTIGVKAAINAKMQCYVLLNGLNKANEFADLPIAGFIRSEEDLNDLG